jgi:peptidoglycan hydrolase CwlO-like protein
MEATSVKNKQTQVLKHESHLTALEEKVLHVVAMIKDHKSEIASLKEKNKDLQNQIKALESSLVSETRDLEELSQEKMMTKAFVDNLLHSIDSLIEVKEK